MRISFDFGEARVGGTSSRIGLCIVTDSCSRLLLCNKSAQGHSIVRPAEKYHVKEHQVWETNSVRKMLDLEVYGTTKKYG
jgi:hypothetical protein